MKAAARLASSKQARVPPRYQNAVALLKQDAGVWILARASTYSGGTTVNDGTLVGNNVTGSATGTGSLTISNGGGLGGNGTAGSLTAGVSLTQQTGGVIFAGQNGVQDAQTLTLQAGAGFTISGSIKLDIIGGAANGTLNALSGSNDLLVFSGGSVTLSGATLNIRTALPVTSGTWVAGSTWNLIDWTTVSDTFDTVTGLTDLSSLGLEPALLQRHTQRRRRSARALPRASGHVRPVLAAVSSQAFPGMRRARHLP